MSAIIANLRNVANDINNTTRAQNQMLDRVHKKDESDIQRVGMAVQKAGELMGWTQYCSTFTFHFTLEIPLNLVLKHKVPIPQILLYFHLKYFESLA